MREYPLILENLFTEGKHCLWLPQKGAGLPIPR